MHVSLLKIKTTLGTLHINSITYKRQILAFKYCPNHDLLQLYGNDTIMGTSYHLLSIFKYT